MPWRSPPQAWKTKVATSTIAWMRDQPAFNLITHEGVGGHSLVPAVRVPSHEQAQQSHGVRRDDADLGSRPTANALR